MMWSLGEFRPTEYTPWAVEDEFTHFLAERLSKVADVHVRPPDHEWSMMNSQYGAYDVPEDEDVTNFHDDGELAFTTDEMCPYLILWANEAPTFFRAKWARKKVHRGKPYEVVMINNRSCHHRAPKHVDQEDWSNRWFIRAMIPQSAVFGPEVVKFP